MRSVRTRNRIGELVDDPMPPPLVEEDDGYTVRIDEHCRIEHVPMSLPTLVDIDGDGRADVRAEYPLTVIDSNQNAMIDAGDELHFGAPRLIPLGNGVRLIWCESHTFSGVQRLVDWIWGVNR